MSPAKENTWRALQGEPLLMQWSCRFGIHKWTVWVYEPPHEYGSGKYSRSYRHCACCNKKEIGILKIPEYC